jgi:hypothetical protein
MKKFFLYIITVTAVLVSSCGGNGPQNETITGPKIEAYCKGYKALKETAPDLLKLANSQSIDIQQKGFNAFEGVLKENGLTYKEFVVLNAKIGAVYSVMQGEDFMNQMGNMKEEGMEQMDEGMKQLQAQIDNPETPTEAKEELKKALEEMKKNKTKINTEFDKNKGWADLVMNGTKKICNVFIDPKEAELVKQYADQITEAYTGMAPSNFNVKE